MDKEYDEIKFFKKIRSEKADFIVCKTYSFS